MADLFIQVLIIHLVVDFLGQPAWMAKGKHVPLSLASLSHAGLHFFAYLLVLTPLGALALAMIHMIIDWYVLQAWWFQRIRPDLWAEQPSGTWFASVWVWVDQIMHLVSIYFIVWGGTSAT